VANLPLQTSVGDFRLRAFHETVGNGELHLALVKGEVRPDQPTLVRVQMQDTLCDLLDAQNLGCNRRLQDSMQHFSNVASGVLLLLRKEGGDAGLMNRLQTLQTALEAKQPAPGSEYDERVFGIGAQILHAVGVGKMRVLGTPYKMHALSGFGLEIIEHVSPDEG
jgi:3,4-dihydroxy 2-butanone 4-phosphate synthase/GTP cyclohydrolase II